jgi:hypothetical protein
MFGVTYIYINGHISRRRTYKPRNSTLSADSHAALQQAADNAKSAPRLAREFHFRDAMKVLDKQLPVGPLHPAAVAQLPLLYPQQVLDPHIPLCPPTGRIVLDRQAIQRYVKSRSSTSSPGISGFGFSWLQFYARLTVVIETDENEDPNWTILVAFIGDLACGSLPWLREWAIQLKGALFNKNPDPTNVKLRNLGIAEILVRITTYMVIREDLPYAINDGLISEFTLVLVYLVAVRNS